MALIEKYMVTAAIADVDPDSLEIKEGMLVAFNGAAGVRRVTTGDGGKVYGVAGDTFSTSASAMPGVSAGWQNRVSDSFDETQASGKMTVYNSGGEFATDQFVDTNMDAANLGHYLKADEATGTLTWDAAAKSLDSIAQLTRAAGTYPSGVPGVDINGDIALGGDNSNQYIEFKLLI
jgi:hypothetical protein